MFKYIDNFTSDGNNEINYSTLKDKLHSYIDEEAISYIYSYIELNQNKTKFLKTSSSFNVENMTEEDLSCFVNLKKINDIRYLNKFFEQVNQKLLPGGIFIGCAETYQERKRRIIKKYPKAISYPYYALDFTIKRVLPKVKYTKRLYFKITRGLNRVLSLPEILGRLVSCGFSIVDYKEINNVLYYVVKKVGTPFFDMEPSYGPLFKMRRIGWKGETIYVYKFRTMHPYAEYLQEYVYKKNNLAVGGKFKDDFRITAWGRIFRKLWIDELPMIINFLRGELKLVGVRPLSNHYLSLYTQELKEKRVQVKPGLIPPFYSDMPKTFEEIMQSEINYLDAYKKHPLITDTKYFCKAFYNIVFKRKRSN